MKKILFIICAATLLLTAGCKKDSEFLDVLPAQVLTNEQAFSDPAQVLSILADLYNRQVDFSGLDNDWDRFADFSESFPSSNGSVNIVQRNEWNFNDWSLWDYNYIRDLNLFIERATAAKTLSEADRTRFLAEARFLRANFYFETAKRMGGVPLITQSLLYDFSGDATY
ncbi:MAG TPA: RagB/SusD family nutrient uptake outer membrane protein, partial [Niastella sp.]|nr:RagB/SusD family nutrient uptake outer membrane protein [Niastella sp.]